jgi:hypothetical protein
LQGTKRILLADFRFREEGHGMKRLWKIYVDRMTTGCIKMPYFFAFNGMTSGLIAVVIFSRHDTDLVDKFVGFSVIFAGAVQIYFLARAVDRLRNDDLVSQRDELMGLHLNQK